MFLPCIADDRIDVADIADLRKPGCRRAQSGFLLSWKIGAGQSSGKDPAPSLCESAALASKHGEGAPPGTASSRRGALTVSRQPGSCEIRSTRARSKAIRALPKREDPVPMAATTTTFKRTTSVAWAWQVITRDGTDWRQGVRSSSADAENDARAARGALEGGSIRSLG